MPSCDSALAPVLLSWPADSESEVAHGNLARPRREKPILTWYCTETGTLLLSHD
jgi:hypothetical protein